MILRSNLEKFLNMDFLLNLPEGVSDFKAVGDPLLLIIITFTSSALEGEHKSLV